MSDGRRRAGPPPGWVPQQQQAQPAYHGEHIYGNQTVMGTPIRPSATMRLVRFYTGAEVQLPTNDAYERYRADCKNYVFAPLETPQVNPTALQWHRIATVLKYSGPKKNQQFIAIADVWECKS